MTSSETKLRVCLVQFASQESVSKSLSHLEELVERAVKEHQPHLIALPECFATEYNTELPFLESVAETIKDGQICRTLSALAKKYGLYIVGGTFAERDGDKIYNTTTVWNPNGELIARHRKVHLCDCHLEDGKEFVEVNRFSPGNDMTTFEVNGMKCGIAICFDAHFDEFINMYMKAGYYLIYYIDYGLQYWDLIHRARAAVLNLKHKCVMYGHTMVVDPNGEIKAKAGIDEEILFYEIDLKVVHKFRKEFLLLASRREDVYNKIKN